MSVGNVRWNESALRSTSTWPPVAAGWSNRGSTGALSLSLSLSFPFKKGFKPNGLSPAKQPQSHGETQHVTHLRGGNFHDPFFPPSLSWFYFYLQRQRRSTIAENCCCCCCCSCSCSCWDEVKLPAAFVVFLVPCMSFFLLLFLLFLLLFGHS